MNHKYLLTAFVLVFTFLVSPVQTQAQSTPLETVYRNTLIELIQTLQKQVLRLQAELATKKDVVGEESFGLSGQVQVVATYFVDDESDLSDIKNTPHRDYFKRVYELFPAEYDSKLKKLLVFGGEHDEFDAFVKILPPTHEYWMYAVHQEVAEDYSFTPDTELIIHELAHIISYEEILGVPKSGVASCDSYFANHGCPSESSYLKQFSDAFWSGSDLLRSEQIADSRNPADAAYDYYEQHQDEFVSDYAVLGPEEDFAETFMFYVTGKLPSLGSEARDKINFLNNYSSLRDLKEEVKKSI